MKNSIKKTLLSICVSIEKAHEVMKKTINNNQFVDENLLADLQACAIEVGTELEKEGESTKCIVGLLEEYCEFLYKFSRAENVAVRRTIFKSLRKIFVDAVNQLKQIGVKYEVVFFPYKASMWDTFESIWEATKKNEQCEVHVVPIPYYDKTPEGEFAKFYYEGKEYPNYVEIEDWQEYNLEEHRPDVIFIHNPYDGENYVTSVHPDFYSEKLRAYTDMLVYIPYAVTSKEPVAKEFAFSPGIVYADKVITQSETIRNGYIELYKELERENQCKGAFGVLEDKFFALGSPKLDMVVNAHKRQWNYEGEWERIATKSDGTRKKVVLLNTSINNMLKFDSVYLDKLEQDLELFKKYERTIALLWRPHPLLESAYAAMRPELLERYRQIVEKYRNEKWGIYDESGDLYRAIVFSDAYYGDWSSVATLYQCVSKPVMIRNCKDLYASDKFTSELIQLPIVSLTKGEKSIYAYHNRYNALYEFEKTEETMKFVRFLPNDRNGMEIQFSDMTFYRDKIWFAPQKSKCMVVYDIKDKTVKKYSMPGNEVMAMRFCCGYQDKVYFTPMNHTKIVAFDMKKGMMEIVADMGQFESLVDGVPTRTAGLPIQKDNKIFIPFANPKGVFEFDCETNQIVSLHKINSCITLEKVDDMIYYCNHKGAICKYDVESGVTESIAQLQRNEDKGIIVYFLKYQAGYLYAVPHQVYSNISNISYKIDVKTGVVTEMKELCTNAEIDTDRKNGYKCFCGLWEDTDGSIYTYSNVKNAFVVLREEGEIEVIPVKTDVIPMFEQCKTYLWENTYYSVENFMHMLIPQGEKLLGNSSKSAEILVKQIAMRRLKEKEPEVGLYNQDGKNGERILEMVLNEL